MIDMNYIYAVVTTDNPPGKEALMTIVDPLGGAMIQCVTSSDKVLAMFIQAARQTGRTFKVYRYGQRHDVTSLLQD